MSILQSACALRRSDDVRKCSVSILRDRRCILGRARGGAGWAKGQTVPCRTHAHSSCFQVFIFCSSLTAMPTHTPRWLEEASLWGVPCLPLEPCSLWVATLGAMSGSRCFDGHEPRGLVTVGLMVHLHEATRATAVHYGK